MFMGVYFILKLFPPPSFKEEGTKRRLSKRRLSKCHKSKTSMIQNIDYYKMSTASKRLLTKRRQLLNVRLCWVMLG